MQGLNEAVAFAEGNDTGARIHDVAVPVANGTLLNWEHGRRRPTGPAQVLLALIARKPSVVKELLR